MARRGLGETPGAEEEDEDVSPLLCGGRGPGLLDMLWAGVVAAAGAVRSLFVPPVQPPQEQEAQQPHQRAEHEGRPWLKSVSSRPTERPTRTTAASHALCGRATPRLSTATH